MTRVSQTMDRVDVTFDDDNLVANAGLLLPATLVERLGLEALINTTVRLDGRVGGAAPGRKVLTLMNTMLAGGSHSDHADMLRAGTTAKVVSHRVMAHRRSARSCERSRLVMSVSLKRSTTLPANAPGQ